MRAKLAQAGRRGAVLTALVALIALASPSGAGDAIPVETLKHIKNATVFVKVEYQVPGVAKLLHGSGSGFLMKVDGTTGYIATNHHVVNPPDKLKDRVKPAGPPTLVFWSGTRQERVVKAEVLASDPSRDLAILRVTDFKDLPKPIAMNPKLELIETMGVYIFGFPFGQALSTTKGNPAMTVGKGSVSSIRENERGEIQVVQIDGDLNPGNSGGPVVDSKGRLV